ncbi:MAG: OmpA family protein [Saprospiraceae bacterium]
MIFRKTKPRTLLTAVALLGMFTAFGQTKKGFKYLDKEKWAAAATAFAADTTNLELRPAAYFGLASTLAAPANPQHNYAEAMRLRGRAQDRWKELKMAQRTDLTKKFQVTSAAMEKLKTTSITAAWKEIEKSATLQQVDQFLEAYQGARSPTLVKAGQKQDGLVEMALNEAKTYADFSYLSNHHRRDIPVKYPTALAAIDQSAFDLFLQEKGVDWLGQFYAENPQHPLTRDDARNEFPEIWNSGELEPMLDFLATYPGSGFNPYIRRKSVVLLKAEPLTEAQRAQLSPEQKAAVGELELEAAGQLVNTDAPFDPAANDAWLHYVQKLAPSSRAYDALEKMTQYYLWKRDWPAASKGLHLGKSLFPEEQTWFDQLIPLVDAPGTGITAVSIGANINAGGSEYIPVPTVDGKTLYFCATGREENEEAEDIFVSYWQDSIWSKPKLVTELSGAGNQAPLSLTEGDSRMIIFDDMKPYQADKTVAGWTRPVPLNVDVSQFYWVGLVQIAANGQVMLLEARDRNGSDIDLYVCLRDENGAWKKPQRLDALSTDGDDRSPYLHPDVHTLYFSTNGHAGMGGLDVYRSTALDDSWLHWSTPENLGKEINTLGDDWGYKISTDGKIAWFASRTDGRYQDIFYTEVPKEMRPDPVKEVEFTLLDDQNKPLTNVQVIMEAQKTGKKVGTYRPDPNTGKVVMPVPNDQVYTIHVEKEGYISRSELIPVQKAGQTLTIKPNLRPSSIQKMTETGQTLSLNLLFDYDQAVLQAESFPELRRVAEEAKKNHLRVNVFGYTDNAGDPAYNLDLSKRRAAAARQALVDMGIPASQITSTGFGEAKPVAPNDTDENRAQNRRVEVQFVNEN